MQPAKHIHTTKPSYIREILSVAASQEVISLAGGLPCPDTFPMPIIEQVMPQMAFEKSLFQYAETAGYQPLIEDLRAKYKVPETHDVLITTGSQQGIDICARTFVAPGDKIVVEDPSYLGALQVFSMAQAEVLSITQQTDGPDLTQLENLFQQHDIKFFYAVPDFHNPTGCCWSLAKRQGVAALCTRYQVLFIEDAPYRKMRFSGIELPTVSHFCPNESIVLRSFSKMVAPGLRIAALITPQRWSAVLNKLKQSIDLHTSVPMQHLTQQILKHPDFDAHLSVTNQRYAQRYQALGNELSTLPTDRYQFSNIDGGMFVWLNIPTCDTLALANKALENGVAVVPCSEFRVDNPKANDQSTTSALRLNFSRNEPTIIQQGIARLKPVLEQFGA